MFHIYQNTTSYWQGGIEPPIFSPLQEDRHTDICIVGAGICGALSAYILLKHGHQVVLLDRESFGENESGRTSGHLSNVLDEGYQTLIKQHGLKGAKKAYQSHSDAIDLIEKIINEENIDCDFRRLSGYLIQDDETKNSYLDQEMEALQRVNFRGAEFVSHPPDFFSLGRAIRYPDQGRIHLLKFLKGLWHSITALGGEIYTHTKVTEFRGGDHPLVKTSTGAVVHASNILVCTNVPINDRFGVHLKESAYRTYVVGVEIPADSFPDVLLWDTKDPYHYVRLIKETKNGFDTLLVGGEDHRVGQDDHSEARFASLETWIKRRLNVYNSVTTKWSGQIIEPSDGMAYIGRSPGEDHIYISCGDSGHGITHSAIASMIFRDLLSGSPNEWLDLYSPQRLNILASQTLVKENANTFLQYLNLIHIEKDAKKDTLLPGEGTLTRHGLAPVALYCDEKNQIHSFSAICPHLGGVIHWNEAEKTWDCPCHGSRFAATGEVLNGPAIENLRTTLHTSADEIQELSRDNTI